jgi:hypothetical protein
VTADENDANHACTLFLLTHNLYNGYMPSKVVEWMVARAVPKTVTKFYDSVVDGHKRFFCDKDELNKAANNNLGY